MLKRIVTLSLVGLVAGFCWFFTRPVQSLEGEPGKHAKRGEMMILAVTANGEKEEKVLRECEGTAVPDSDHLIKTEVGHEFTVTLSSNPTTGYQWQMAEPLDSSLLKWVSNTYTASDSQLLGGSGKEVWTFKAVGRGKTRIAMKYVRPWEKDISPVKRAVFSVEIR